MILYKFKIEPTIEFRKNGNEMKLLDVCLQYYSQNDKKNHYQKDVRVHATVFY